MSCSSALPSARQKSVIAYPKQRATVLVGSVLKWRARPQCLRRQKKCLRVSKTESYGLSRICFEMTRQATMLSSKAWLCLADQQHMRFTILWRQISDLSGQFSDHSGQISVFSNKKFVGDMGHSIVVIAFKQQDWKASSHKPRIFP
jgi:hypothetical protein